MCVPSFTLPDLSFSLRNKPLTSRLHPQAYRAPLWYNLSVAREFLKQVYLAERLQPPTNPQTWSTAYTTLAQRAQNPSYWRGIFKSGEWAKVGIYALEAYGIFKVSLHYFIGGGADAARVGYRSDPCFSSTCNLFVQDCSYSLFLQIGEIIGRRSLVGYKLQ